MIDWNSCAPLTKNEWMSFISPTFSYLKDLDMKNDWDFFINECGFDIFWNMAISFAYSKDYPEEYQENFTKYKDVESMFDIIDEIGWEKEEQEYRNDKHYVKDISDLIYNKILNITNQVFDD